MGSLGKLLIVGVAAVLLIPVTWMVKGIISGTYGSAPVNISVGPGGRAPNGPSGEPTVSGDNRTVRYVAYSSEASNLVHGDENAARDIFVWARPLGVVPRHLSTGSLRIASVNNSGGQLNGDSSHPSLDGSMENGPHCVAFQTVATNASSHDTTDDSDIYVRDLRSHKTYWASRGVHGDATQPSIAGNCKKVAFQADGSIWVSAVGYTNVKRIGGGKMPDFSRDGESLTYVNDGEVVFRHGSTVKRLSRGANPTVSDYASVGGWAVTYNSNGNVRIGLIMHGRARDSVAVHDASNGGVTARAAARGIVVWTRGNSVNYLNRHTGNSDDLAYANDEVTEVDCSARANMVAFAATGGDDFIDAKGNSQRSVYVMWLPK
ncbi:MAG: hypothetical protein JHC98_08990 [Thermoleophilaceae bacterium]|nr:hypothetical protein [Thermoleophilaceae bacterium]